MQFDLKKYLKEKKRIIDKWLEEALPPENTYPEILHKAMRYTLFAGGKRIRPILMIASYDTVKRPSKYDEIIPFACGIEMIHAYSLIHDDLPCMDDDDFRRGKPTNHRVFGEAIALLAGDGLLTEAFSLMSRKHKKLSPTKALLSIQEIAKAAGISGMVGGQVVDFQSQGKKVDKKTIEYIHNSKTGALILASVRVGAIIGEGDKKALDALTKYGKAIGLCFQVMDDILDIEGDQEILGKDIGSDIEKEKATYPAVFGMESSKDKVKELLDEAITALDSFDKNAEPLREIARFIVKRSY